MKATRLLGIIFFLNLSNATFGQNITFVDKKLESAIKVYLNKSESYNLTIQDLNTIEILDVSGNNIENIYELRYCIQLRELNLSSNNIFDLAPISNLTTLRLLNISFNNITVVNSLSNYSNCLIAIQRNKISDISPINRNNNVIDGSETQNAHSNVGNSNFYLKTEILDFAQKRVRFHFRSGSDSGNNAILNVGDKKLSSDPWDYGLYDIVSDGQSRYIDHTFRNLGQYTAFLYFNDPNSSTNRISHTFSLAQQINFSISSTATTICSGETMTLNASGCSGTVQWNESLGIGTSKTVSPTSNKTYYADCLYSGTSKRSNEITVTVKSVPNSPTITNNYPQIDRGQSATLIASGCASGTTYYWKDMLAADRVTFYPTYSDSYTAYCVKDGCNSAGAITAVNVLDINCDIGEVNNNPSTAHTLFEFKDKLASTRTINGDEYPDYVGLGKFCIKNPTDNVDWYKFKIHEKWYYLKVSINGNSCPECIYKLRFQIDGVKLYVLSYLYTSGETANLQVFDSDQVTILGSQNFNSSTEHSLEINICNSFAPPVIDFEQSSHLNRCSPSAFILYAKHPLYRTPTNLSFSWSENSDGSNELGNYNSYFTPTLSSEKTYYVRLKIENGCLGPKTDVIVRPNLSPNTPSPTITLNKNNISLGESITLTANGCPSNVEWVLQSSKIYGTEAIYTPFMYPQNNTETQYYYARCITGNCIGATQQSPAINVHRIAKPSISSSKTNICISENITLSATGCNVGTITWNNNLGTGTSKSVSPTVTTTYAATCTLNGATTDFGDGVTVFVNNFSGGEISPVTQNLCQNINSSTNRTLEQNISLSNYAGDILRWEYKAPNANWSDWGQAGVESPSNCCFGTITGTWKVRAVIGNGVCQSVYSPEASIVVLPLPTAPVVSPVTIYSGQTATLTATSCGGTVKWYSSTTSSTVLFSGSSFTTPVLTANTTYYSSCTTNNCESSNRTSVLVTVSTSNPCPNTITHTGNISAGVYNAGEFINSSGNVGTNTIYRAGKAIMFLPGFSAGGNDFFLAQIQGCTNTPTNILQDDFNDNVFDNIKWQRDNTTNVFENAGVLKLEQNQTDVPTNLSTNWIAIEQNKTLLITRKVWVSPSTTNSTYANFYYGSLSIRFNNDPNKSIYIGYQRDGYNGGVYGTPTDGLIIVSSLTGASPKIRAGNNIFGSWFDEKIEYSISTGILKYYQNNSLLATYNAGLPNSTNLNFSLNFSPFGWWTGHKHYMDDISVSKF